MDFHGFMTRYTVGFYNVIKCYCDWAESQSKSERDLLMLAFAPIALAGLIIWTLPVWVGKVIALFLIAPVIYSIYMVLRTLDW